MSNEEGVTTSQLIRDSPNAVLQLCQRLRRWHNCKTTLGERTSYLTARRYLKTLKYVTVA